MSTEKAPGNSFQKYCLILLSISALVGVIYDPTFRHLISGMVGGFDYYSNFFVPNWALERGIANIYDSEIMVPFAHSLGIQDLWVYCMDPHPPGFYVLTRPFIYLSFLNGCILNIVLQVVGCFIVLAIFCQLYLKGRGFASGVTGLLYLMLLLLGPGVDSILFSQINFYMLGGFLLLFILWQKQYRWAAGLVLAALILAKMYPAFLLLFFLRRRDWQTPLWAGVGIMLLTIIAGLNWGFSLSYDCLAFWFGNSWTYVNTFINQSLMATILTFAPDISQQLLKVVNLLTILLTAAFLIYIPYRQPRTSSPEQANYSNEEHNLDGDLIEYAIYVGASSLLSPISWIHHHLVFIVPMLAFIRLGSSQPSYRPASAIGLAAGCLLMCSEGIFIASMPVRETMQILSTYHFGTLLMVCQFVAATSIFCQFYQPQQLQVEPTAPTPEPTISSLDSQSAELSAEIEPTPGNPLQDSPQESR